MVPRASKLLCSRSEPRPVPAVCSRPENGPAKGLLSDSASAAQGLGLGPADQAGSLSRIMKCALLFRPPACPGCAAGLPQTLNPTDKQVRFYLRKALTTGQGCPAEEGTNSPERFSG